MDASRTYDFGNRIHGPRHAEHAVWGRGPKNVTFRHGCGLEQHLCDLESLDVYLHNGAVGQLVRGSGDESVPRVAVLQHRVRHLGQRLLKIARHLQAHVGFVGGMHRTQVHVGCDVDPRGSDLAGGLQQSEAWGESVLLQKVGEGKGGMLAMKGAE
jgi:hypothetical protein